MSCSPHLLKHQSYPICESSEEYYTPIFTSQLSPELTGKKFGLVKEVIDLATEEVRETIMAAIEKMRSAGAVVEEISIPEHITGIV